MKPACLALSLLSLLAASAQAQVAASAVASPAALAHYSMLDERSVSVASGLGAVSLSRQYGPLYATVAGGAEAAAAADPVLASMAGDAVSLVGDVRQRNSDSLRYVSPALHGVSASALYSYDASPYNDYLNRAYGAVLGYASGPVVLRIAHQRRNNFIQASGSSLAVDTSARNTMVAANLNLGLASVYAGVGQSRGDGRSPWDVDNPYGAMTQSTHATNTRDALVGVSLPYGRASLMASYIRKNDRELANQDARQLAVGIRYTLSLRTNFYAAYAKIHNLGALGNASAPFGDSAVNLGLRHAF